MNIDNLNIDQICSITVYEKTVERGYEYRKAKTLFGFQTSPSGIYYVRTFGSPYRVPEEIIPILYPTLYVEDNVVYFKPHVEIRMSDKTKYEKYFKNKQELEAFMQSSEIQKIKLLTP